MEILSSADFVLVSQMQFLAAALLNCTVWERHPRVWGSVSLQKTKGPSAWNTSRPHNIPIRSYNKEVTPALLDFCSCAAPSDFSAWGAMSAVQGRASFWFLQRCHKVRWVISGRCIQAYQNGQSSWNGSSVLGEEVAGTGGRGQGKEGQDGGTTSPSQTCRSKSHAGAGNISAAKVMETYANLVLGTLGAACEDLFREP